MQRKTWPTYRTVSELIHAHAGRPAVVLGGGPSLTTDHLCLAPTDAIHLSANDHGLRFLADHPELQRAASYIVVCDKIEQRSRYDIRNGSPRPWNVPLITRKCYGDFRIVHSPAPLTGLVCAWLARLMGCSPIIAVGMDLYAGPTYHDDASARSAGKLITSKEHRLYWHQLRQKYPAMYRAIGCHAFVREELGVYRSDEPAQPPVSIEQIKRDNPEVQVKITRPAEIYQRKFAPGTVINVGQKEAATLFHNQQAIKA